MASGTGGTTVPDVSASSTFPSWLLKAKVTVPERQAAYVRRASLQQSLDGLLERRLTVLRAPAGFGKTAALAEVARDTREQGPVVAWISLDDDDAPNVFGCYFAYAFAQAGLDIELLDAHDAWSSSPAVQQMGMLARAIELHGAPCLLVLDEVDRLPGRTVELIDLLLRRAPDNLHVALAFRADPGLDLASHVLDGGATVVGAQQFRFSKAEIAQFFQGNLSRRELTAIEERTAGWPVALMVYRTMRTDEKGELDAETVRLTANYLGVRLLRDLSAEERACLLDLAVFDWIDADFVDDVLGSSDARLRVTALPALDGLLLPLDRDRSVRRLHPLLKDYCLDLLAVEDPARKRSVHKRIALALARRGHLAPAWRHASAAGDSRLVGDHIERFGVFQLWLREGVARLISAGRFLTPEIAASHPRLELLRCIVLQLSSKFDEAKALFEATARNTDGFTRDRDGGDDRALAMDRAFTQGFLSGGADGLPPGDVDALLPAAEPVAVGDEPALALARARHTLLCVAFYERANFQESCRHGAQAQAHFTEDVRFGDLFVNIHLGMAAMAQGRVADAVDCYGRARQGARRYFSSDPCLTVSTDVLTIELDLERNREKTIQQRTLRSLTELRGTWADIYATAIAVSAELTFAQYDSEAIIQLLTKTVDEVRATRNRSLFNNLAALLAYYLVEVGRPDEAGRAWAEHGLTRDPNELLDLERQSWRAMESLSCARIRLLAAEGDPAAAGELADQLCSTASERGLVRTLMRGLALSMDVAQRAGQPDRALARLRRFLHLTRDVDYIRPLVRNREVSRAALEQLLRTDLDDDTRQTAESTLAKIGEQPDTAAPLFSARELEVLAEVGRGRGNKEVARLLGITDEGVRYHLKNIYRKTGVHERGDAVRYAQSLGVLP